MGATTGSPHAPVMTTSLHIEHRIDSDFDDWLATFRSFDEIRTRGGVTSTTVRHAVGDPRHVAVDLEFASADEARAFLEFLETQVWPNSPHLTGTPSTSLLEPVA